MRVLKKSIDELNALGLVADTIFLSPKDFEESKAFLDATADGGLYYCTVRVEEDVTLKHGYVRSEGRPKQ